MTITPEEFREQLAPHLDRIAEQAARRELGRRLAGRVYPRVASHDLDDCRQYVVERLLRPSTLAAMASAYCLRYTTTDPERVRRLACGWARNLARHFLRDEVYRHRRRCICFCPEMIPGILETSSATDDPVMVLLQKENESVLADLVLRAELELKKLPSDQRRAVELVVLRGMTKTEVAALLGCDRKTVVNRIAKACSALRRSLSSDGARRHRVP